MKKLTIFLTCFCLIPMAATLLSSTRDVDNQKQYFDEITISADLKVNYDSMYKLMADAEVIAAGTVCNIETLINQQGLICSIVDTCFKNASPIDAKLPESLSVFTEGGSISARAFYEFHKEYITLKLGSEVFENQVQNMKSSDKVESKLNEVENVKTGDNVLLFLTYDESLKAYRITGSSFYGKFEREQRNPGDTTDTYKRHNKYDSENVTVTSESLALMVSETIDNSYTIRMARKEQTINTKEAYIIEKNPAFDVYKS